ncbi:haloacid dehalogenase type II [Flammeovirga pacifica]|uniref:Haloacid dehalogenase, type II n=1 Tax=Flammeovirga pacifica TaxID=915059 RepID=A0A1S1Z638_FLAPC|nr:haloacid dehalogenase type II [Flammeovirga pacifica]OHX68515.1 haloacid dehalogenase, type II [Flammeovirga pacifica]
MTLAFDIYGTLINTSGVFDSIKKLIGEKVEGFNQLWRTKQLEYSFRRAAMNDYVDFSVCTKQALEYACLFYKVDLEEHQKASLMEEYKVLPAFDDVKKNLERLRSEGHQLYAFSNGSKEAIKGLLINAGLVDHFDGMISVEEQQVFKPSPIVYQHVLDVTSSIKETTYLISSNPFDVLGAKAFGLQSIWVQRSKESILDPWEYQPNRIISTLSGLTFTK